MELTYLRVSGYNFKKCCIILSEETFTFTNSIDPDEIQQYAAFLQGLHCLQKYSSGVSPIQSVFTLLLYCSKHSLQ